MKQLIVSIFLFLYPIVTFGDVSFVSVGTAGGSATGNCVPGVPANIQDKDILILQVVSDDQNAHTANNGYTQIVQGNGAGAFQRMSIWWKRTTGTESLTTVTHSGRVVSCSIIAFRGAEETGSPINANSATVGGDCTSTSTASAITTSINGAMIVHHAGNQGGTPSYSGWSGLATTEAFDIQNGTPDFVHSAAAYGLQTSSGSTGNQTATISETACNSTALTAIAPESTPTPPPAPLDIFSDWSEIGSYIEFGNAVAPNSSGSSTDCGLTVTDIGTGGTRIGQAKGVTLVNYGQVRFSARFANTAAQTGTVSCRLYNLTDSQDLTTFKDINNTTSCVSATHVVGLPAITSGIKRVVCECKSTVATDDPILAWCVGEFL